MSALIALAALFAPALAARNSRGTPFCGTCANGGAPPMLDTQMQLSCAEQDATISSVDFVTYGDPPAARVCGAFARGTCDGANATAIVTSACLGQPSCEVWVNTTVFGDPCFGVFKVLAVQATCSSGAGSALCVWAPPPTPRVPLAVPADAAAETISPRLFGLNLEFTRHDIFNGISAELVSNTQFALQPAGTTWPYPWPAGVPPHWAPIGVPTFLPIGGNGRGSGGGGVVCNINSNAQSCGVSQSPVAGGFNGGRSNGASIGLQAGAAYSLLIVVAATADMRVNVSLSGGALPLTMLAVPDTGVTSFLRVNFTSPVTVPNATLTLEGYLGGDAPGTLTLTAVSIMPQSTFLGMRTDVVAQLAALNSTGTLRYPGGCFAPFYRWKEQLQPLALRPTIWTPPDYCTAVAGGVNAYSDGFLQSAPNVDEYIALCRFMGATPSITVALQFGTAEEIQDARDLVEYTNGDAATTVWGALRASRGFPMPYNVSVWYLGNEIAGQSRYANYPAVVTAVGPPSAAEYVAMLQQLVPAMLAVDPTLRLSAVEAGAAWDTAWASDPAVSPFISLTSFHGAYSNSGPDGSPVEPQDFIDQATEPDTVLPSSFASLRSLLDVSGGKNVSISADEWGLGPPWLATNFNVGHAMHAASVLSAAANVAATVKLAGTNYFEPINEGAIVVDQFVAGTTPVGVVLPLFARYGGMARIPVANSTNGSDLAILAASDPATGDVLLTLSNRNCRLAFAQPVAVTLPSTTSSCTTPAAVTLLTPTDLSLWATFTVLESNISVAPNCTATVTVPAYGIAQVRFSVASAPAAVA